MVEPFEKTETCQIISFERDDIEDVLRSAEEVQATSPVTSYGETLQREVEAMIADVKLACAK